jgi:hypothetical protein
MATPRLAALKAAPSMAEFLHRQQVFSLYRQVFRKSRQLPGAFAFLFCRRRTTHNSLATNDSTPYYSYSNVDDAQLDCAPFFSTHDATHEARRQPRRTRFQRRRRSCVCVLVVARRTTIVPFPS